MRLIFAHYSLKGIHTLQIFGWPDEPRCIYDKDLRNYFCLQAPQRSDDEMWRCRVSAGILRCSSKLRGRAPLSVNGLDPAWSLLTLTLPQLRRDDLKIEVFAALTAA